MQFALMLLPLEGIFDWATTKAGDFEAVVKIVGGAILVGVLAFRLVKEFTLARLIINALIVALAVFVLNNISWSATQVDQEIKAAMIGPIAVVPTPGPAGPAPIGLTPDVEAPQTPSAL